MLFFYRTPLTSQSIILRKNIGSYKGNYTSIFTFDTPAHIYLKPLNNRSAESPLT